MDYPMEFELFVIHARSLSTIDLAGACKALINSTEAARTAASDAQLSQPVRDLLNLHLVTTQNSRVNYVAAELERRKPEISIEQICRNEALGWFELFNKDFHKASSLLASIGQPRI